MTTSLSPPLSSSITLGKLRRGINCKACGRQISSDPELCSECLSIAMALVKDLDGPDDDDFIPYDEVMRKAALKRARDAAS